MDFNVKRIKNCFARFLAIAVVVNALSGVSSPVAAFAPQYAVQVFDPAGKYRPDIQPLAGESAGKLTFEFPAPSPAFRPGKYTAKFFVVKGGTVYVSESSFTWGVIALNFNKTVYGLNLKDEARIGFSVLDDFGHTICDAAAELAVAAPGGAVTYFSTADGTISRSSECAESSVTNSPDYYTSFTPDKVGRYDVSLTATTANGTRETRDHFMVEQSPQYNVERIGPTRIYPPATYRMDIAATSASDFSGTVEEKVPASFEILRQGIDGKTMEQSSSSFGIGSFLNFLSQGAANPQAAETKTISWPVSLSGGKGYRLWYEFRAPKISPEFYLLGPAKFSPRQNLVGQAAPTWQEARQWQIAADALTISTGALANSTEYANGRKLLRDSEGNLIAMFVDSSNNAKFAALNNGSSTWTVYSAATASVANLSADIASSTNIVSVAYENTASNPSVIYFEATPTYTGNNITGVSFSGTQTLAAGATNNKKQTPSLIMLANGKPGVAWAQNTGGSVHTSNVMFLRCINTCTSAASSNWGGVAGTANGTPDAVYASGINTILFPALAQMPARGTAANNLYFFLSISGSFSLTEVVGSCSNCSATPPTWTLGGTVSLDASIVSASRYTYLNTVADTRGQRVVVAYGSTNATNCSSVAYCLASFFLNNAGATSTTNIINSNATEASVDAQPSLAFTSSTSNYEYYVAGLKNSSGNFFFRYILAPSSTSATDWSSGGSGWNASTTLDSGTANSWPQFKTSDLGSEFDAAYMSAANTLSYTSSSISKMTQVHYRWRNDDGSETAATWRAAQDTATSTANGIIRLRAEASNEGDVSSTFPFRLQYQKNATSGTWTTVPASSTLTTEVWVMATSTNVSDGAATTNQLTADNATFVAGQVKTTSSTGSGIALSAPNFTEMEYSLRSASSSDITGALNGTYYFRLTSAGTVLDSYIVYPTITLSLQQVPRRPILNSPAPNATTSASAGAFQMTGTDPQSDYLQYQQVIYQNEACTQVVQTNDQSVSQTGWTGRNASNSAAYASGQTGTFTLQSSLTASTTYYWGASAKDPDGSGSFGKSSLTTLTPTWNTSANSLPGAIYGHSAVVSNGYIYTTGGSGGAVTSTVFYAPLNSSGTVGTWQTTTALPSAIYRHSAVVSNGYIYTTGGTTGNAVTSTVFYAPLNSSGTVGTWQTTTALPSAIYDHSAVASNGYIYTTGGLDSGSVATSTVFYAPLNSNGTVGTWQTTTALPRAIYDHSAVVSNGYIYTTGGLDSGGVVTSAVFYAPLNSSGTVGTWQTTTALPSAIYDHSAVVSNGYIYTTGGLDSGSVVTSTVFYAAIGPQQTASGTISSWLTTTALPSAIYRRSAVAYNGYIYTTGGAVSVATSTVQSAGLYTSCTLFTTPASASTISCSASTSTTSFGTIDTTAVYTSSPNASTSMTCSGGLGCTLYVQDAGNTANAGLYSSVSAYLIPSPNAAFNSTAALAAGTDGYGIQATTTAAGSGGTLTVNPRYLQTGNTVGGLSTTTVILASSTAAVTGREALITHLAAAGASALGGSYTDTITYSCVSN